MPRHVNGQLFYSAGEVADLLGIARQTLWRWHKRGEIPAGAKFRDRTRLFSEHELETIRAFATRIEPIELITSDGQLGLFDGDSKRRRA